MSDRHLCKAKRTDNGEWIEGYYVRYGKCDWIYTGEVDKLNEFDNHYGIKIYPAIKYLVDPSTLCQCTGLKDKNGKLIWENDICIINSGHIDEEDVYFTIEWDNDGARFILASDGLTVDFDNYYGYECEIIGNIFDNPELLEGGAGND